MDTKSQRPWARLKERESSLSALNVAIEATDLAKELSSITPAKDIFDSVSVTLTMLRVRSCQFVLLTDYKLKCT